MTERLGPRLVVAGTHSGVGKTTIATGLMAALRRRGQRVASAKVGPDYIDPGYHALATGRPGRNLDPWMCGVDAVGPLAGRATRDADVLVVEGVMGLFDGAADGSPSSTADVARLLEAPVLLVVDARAMSASVAALVHGFASFDASVRVAGVVLNRVGSDSHEAMLRSALGDLGVPVLGALRRDDALSWRDRHLGLVPVIEKPTEVAAALDLLAARMASSCDLDAIVGVASSALSRSTESPRLPAPGPTVPVAVAGGPAFSFSYRDNLEALEAGGAEIMEFDPVVTPRLPDGCRALVAGGGFPEVFVESLATNRSLADDVRERVEAGLVTWAECGGLLWLADSLDGSTMAGAVATSGRMTDQLTLGYRRARTSSPSPLGAAGLELRGHEFHYSVVEPGGDALELEGRTGIEHGGFAGPTLLASYLHVHLGDAPELADRFLATARG
jgi:cobyrinic acid a,c-diamide synthase